MSFSHLQVPWVEPELLQCELKDLLEKCQGSCPARWAGEDITLPVRGYTYVGCKSRWARKIRLAASPASMMRTLYVLSSLVTSFFSLLQLQVLRLIFTYTSTG